MNFEIGNNIMYKNVGVCVIEGIEKKKFTGEDYIEYYKLKPISGDSTIYYIPVKTATEQLRDVFSEEKVNEIIDNMQNESEIWFNDSRERRTIFGKILKSDDYESIIRMIKALYSHRNEKLKNHKHLSSSDEMLLNSAEKLMFQEFAVALGIEPENVRDYIISRIEQ